MPHTPNARTYKRFLFDAPLIVGGEAFVCEGTLRNLSMYGCSMICDREVLLGSSVRVSLILPDHTSALSIDVGRITWVQGCECGVEFVEIPHPSRLRLNRTLRQALIQFLNRHKNRELPKHNIQPFDSSQRYSVNSGYES